MKITLDLTKTVEENAQAFFEQAKKARRKHKGVQEALLDSRKKLATAQQEPVATAVKKRTIKRIHKREWYEKFRWFFSSDGYLCIGGRDAATNEMVIKKHTDANDWVFHTDMAGSPFVVVKTSDATTTTHPEGGAPRVATAKSDKPTSVAGDVARSTKKGEHVPDTTMDEAAQFCASNGRAWKSGMSALETFYVRPDQVTKEAQAGESLPRGAFMIRGKTTYKHPRLALAACVIADGRVMIAPESACKAHAKGKIVRILQGSEKTSDAAKRILQLLETDVPLDDIIRALPPGGVKLG